MTVLNIEESPKLFGAYVENVTASIGWNGQGGSCQFTLVEDPDNDVILTLPEPGTAVYFKYYEFYYGGIFQRWSYKEEISGKKYNVIIESPGGKILNGVNVILNSFEGTAFNEGAGYNKFNPSANPNLTNQVNNVWNPYGHKENFSYGGIFGGANTNSAGFPAVDLLELLELISRGESEFGGPIIFGESEYELDLSDIKSEVPEFFRLSGQSATLNSIIGECCEVIQYDFFVEVNEKSGTLSEDNIIKEPVLKVIGMPKIEQPEKDKVAQIVQEFKEEGNLVSSDIGKELNDEVTQRVVIGGPASRYYVAPIQDTFPIWGKLGPKKYILGTSRFGFVPNTPSGYLPDSKVLISLDDLEPIEGAGSSSLANSNYVWGRDYLATVAELRMASANQESWEAFKVFESIAEDTYNDLNASPWCFGLDINKAQLFDFAIGGRGSLSLASTSLETANKAFKEDIRDYVSRLYNKVRDVANNFYGRFFMVPLPKEPGGILNNIKFIEEDLLEVPSWEYVDSAWVSNKPVSDIGFYNQDARLKSLSIYQIDPDYDYSEMGGEYAAWKSNGIANQFFADGIATTKTGADDGTVFFLSMGEGENKVTFDTPYVVMDTGVQIKDVDEFTTDQFGITYLAKYFFGIDIPPERYLTPGKPNTQIIVPPNIVYPRDLGIPQQSQRYSWGPWYNIASPKGKSEVVFDTNLAPETFGSASAMDQAGFDAARAGNSSLTAHETGRVEVAEFPAFKISDRFYSQGPYITNMSINISVGGVTTAYEFNTWTPNFGKLTKYNADRVSRIYKAQVAALQRFRADNPKRPFKPFKFPEKKEDKKAERLKTNRSATDFQFMRWFNKIPQFKHVEGAAINGADAFGLLNAEPDEQVNQFGCSNDQIFTPAGTKIAKLDTDDGFFMEAPSNIEQEEIEEDGLFASGVAPSAMELCPYFSTAVYDTSEEHVTNVDFINAVNVASGDMTNLAFEENIPEDQDICNIEEVRSIGFRGPMMLSGWGYDVANNPVPNNGQIKEFNKELTSDRTLWKTGPIDLRWDKERKTWKGGLETLTGVVLTDVKAPSSPLEPTEFKLKVLRKVNEEKGAGALEISAGEVITCYNRDPKLSMSKGDNSYLTVMRINYEWVPLSGGGSQELVGFESQKPAPKCKEDTTIWYVSIGRSGPGQNDSPGEIEGPESPFVPPESPIDFEGFKPQKPARHSDYCINGGADGEKAWKNATTTIYSGTSLDSFPDNPDTATEFGRRYQQRFWIFRTCYPACDPATAKICLPSGNDIVTGDWFGLRTSAGAEDGDALANPTDPTEVIYFYYVVDGEDDPYKPVFDDPCTWPAQREELLSTTLPTYDLWYNTQIEGAGLFYCTDPWVKRMLKYPLFRIDINSTDSKSVVASKTRLAIRNSTYFTSELPEQDCNTLTVTQSNSGMVGDQENAYGGELLASANLQATMTLNNFIEGEGFCLDSNIDGSYFCDMMNEWLGYINQGIVDDEGLPDEKLHWSFGAAYRTQSTPCGHSGIGSVWRNVGVGEPQQDGTLLGDYPNSLYLDDYVDTIEFLADLTGQFGGAHLYRLFPDVNRLNCKVNNNFRDSTRLIEVACEDVDDLRFCEEIDSIVEPTQLLVKIRQYPCNVTEVPGEIGVKDYNPCDGSDWEVDQEGKGYIYVEDPLDSFFKRRKPEDLRGKKGVAMRVWDFEGKGPCDDDPNYMVVEQNVTPPTGAAEIITGDDITEVEIESVSPCSVEGGCSEGQSDNCFLVTLNRTIPGYDPNSTVIKIGDDEWNVKDNIQDIDLRTLIVCDGPTETVARNISCYWMVVWMDMFDQIEVVTDVEIGTRSITTYKNKIDVWNYCELEPFRYEGEECNNPDVYDPDEAIDTDECTGD